MARTPRGPWWTVAETRLHGEKSGERTKGNRGAGENQRVSRVAGEEAKITRAMDATGTRRRPRNGRRTTAVLHSCALGARERCEGVGCGTLLSEGSERVSAGSRKKSGAWGERPKNARHGRVHGGVRERVVREGG
jgi:hypothetical protein